jgi:Uma2 family endonuclease
MVMPPLERTALMTVEDYIRRYESEGPFEILDGEVVDLSPVVSGHSDSARVIYRAMIASDPDETYGVVYFEAAFVVVEKARWVKDSRVPDILYFEVNRFNTYREANPDWRKKPFVLVPDLVVEIISETDRYSEVDAKIDGYLKDGVQMVWLVDSRQQTVTLRSHDHYQKLTQTDTLTGGDIIPHFSLPVRAIFA